jgi:CBS domain-containing protein
MNAAKKACRDAMIDVFAFPHVPYWFTLRQVSEILKKSLAGDKSLCPAAVLVFDEKYNLLGHLDISEIMKRFQPLLSGQGSREDEKLKALAEIPASDMMIPARFFVDPDDTVSKAATLMIENNLSMVPVLEEKKKLVGIVRTAELFKELTTVFFSA